MNLWLTQTPTPISKGCLPEPGTSGFQPCGKYAVVVFNWHGQFGYTFASTHNSLDEARIYVEKGVMTDGWDPDGVWIYEVTE